MKTKDVPLKKTYIKSNYIYAVHCYPTTKTYMFEWKPSKKDLKILAEKEGFEIDDYYIDFQITKVKFEDPYNYLGTNFIGYEINKEYYDIAVKRVEAKMRDLPKSS